MGIRNANNTIAEKFSTHCGISCKKLINGEQFKYKQGKNGFLIGNVCPVSGDCMMESTLGALTNVMFGAPLSSSAKEISRGLPTEKDHPAISRQEIYTSISQTLLDKCNIKSTNTISNVEFLTTDRKFNGPISIVQNETMKINCPISTILNASVFAPDTTTTFGKNKEISLLIVIIVIVLSGSGVWAYMKNKNKGSLLPPSADASSA